MLGAPNGNNDMIVAAVKSGDMSLLDQAVERILSMVIKAKETLAQDLTYDRQAHHPLARRVAGEGTALLKNDGDILPIGEKSRVSLIGQFVKTPRYQGAGSSLVNPTLLDNLHDEMVALAGNANLVYAPGY
jgi:beta-glucosidase